MVRTSAASKTKTTDPKTTSAGLVGLVSNVDLDRAFKKRNVKYIYKNLVKQDIEPFLKDGWEKIPQRSRKNIKLRKMKDVGSGFEDEVWCIFYRMGFFEMNKDSNFTIPRFESDVSKQIDVFAREEQCICIVECKSAEKPHTKRVLGTDIDQIAAIKKDINLSIFKHYKEEGNKNKFKIIWILALKNIDISDNDRERAERADIKIIDDSLLEYYHDFSKHFGHSSKFQFLSDLLPNREIPDLIDPIPAIKGSMGQTSFYSFVIEPEKLLKIAYIAHRSKSNVESIETYQRMAKKARLTEISKYIHEKKGIFPTNIVINIETDRPMRFDKAAEMAGQNAVLGTLYLPNIYQCAWIIDGQHRLFAYSDLEEASSATLPVMAFENLDPTVQAQLFVDINGEQIRVSKNHLNDLYSNLHWNSFDPKQRLIALTSTLVKELDKSPKSPLRDRLIKIGGNKTKTRNLTLTGLTTEIEKTQLLGNVHTPKAKEITPGPLYQEDLESTLPRAVDVISTYYSLYLKNEKLKEQWDIGSGDGGYLCTNLGIQATLRILKAILDHLEYKEHMVIRATKTGPLIDEVEKYIQPVITFLVEANPEKIRDFKRAIGESGVKTSTFALLKEINKKFPTFEPPGLKDYIKKTDTSNNAEAIAILQKIEPMIQQHVVKTLKTEFGEDITQWWHNGVPTAIKKKAGEEAQLQGEYKEFEKFLYIVDLKDIIVKNWELFKKIYTIDSRHEDKKKGLDWFTKVNDIRNICYHPPRGGVSKEQLEYLKHIFSELEGRIGSLPLQPA